MDGSASFRLLISECPRARWQTTKYFFHPAVTANTGRNSADDHPDLPMIHHKSDADSARAAAISNKLEERNITTAVSNLCSDDSPADFSSSKLDRLCGKHPSEHAGARLSANPVEKPARQVSEIAVLKAVRSFPAV